MGVIRYNYFHFRNKFCELDGWGNVKKYKNIGEIKAILQSNMLRRLKNQVLKDLPPVVNKNVYVELTADQKKLYKAVQRLDADEALEGFDELEFEDVPSELARHARLFQIAESCQVVGGKAGVKGSAKLEELENLLDDIVSRGEKAVVFSRSKRFVNIMYEHFQKYNPALITGDISSQAKKGQEVSDRQMQVDKFQDDESCKVIFIVSSAGREGITLTRANNLIFTSKDWSPSYISQAIGRIWRMGAQQHKVLNVYSLIARGTIDEKLEKLLADKQFTISSVVEAPLSTKQILATLDGRDEAA
jgi:SNF2 family DNA or RNA helicase